MPNEVANRPVLAEQDVEDDAVDLIVDAVVGERTRTAVRGLAVAIHSAFTLFMARRVPGEVVVEDCIKVLLEVDAFAQAVRTDEHCLSGVATERSVPRVPEADAPVMASTSTPLRHVHVGPWRRTRRRDKTTKEDRPIPVLEQCLDELHCFLELGILAPERFSLAGHCQQRR